TFAFRAQSVAAISAQKHADVQLVLLALKIVEEAANEGEDSFALLFSEIAEGSPIREFTASVLAEIAEPRPVLRLGPWLDGIAIDRQRAIRNHAIHVEIDRIAEALAARTGAEGRVEAEQ